MCACLYEAAAPTVARQRLHWAGGAPIGTVFFFFYKNSLIFASVLYVQAYILWEALGIVRSGIVYS